MKKVVYILLLILANSCAEKLLEKPNNLISKEKMIEILNDLAILNAAKTTNMAILRNHEIEPMQYIYDKYDIDSVQFVESDRYYASLPEQHEEIYIAVEEKLSKEEERLSDEKKVRDSLNRVKSEALRKGNRTINDSLLKSGYKKNR